MPKFKVFLQQYFKLKNKKMIKEKIKNQKLFYFFDCFDKYDK